MILTLLSFSCLQLISRPYDERNQTKKMVAMVLTIATKYPDR